MFLKNWLWWDRIVTNWIFGALAVLLIVWQVGPIIGVRKYTPKSLQSLMDRDQVTIVDVRSPGEYLSGHIPSSQSAPLAEIRQRAAEIDRSKPVVLVCRSGYRAMQAFHILKRRGFSGHGVLQGGIIAWEAFRATQARGGGMDRLAKDDNDDPSV